MPPKGKGPSKSAATPARAAKNTSKGPSGSAATPSRAAKRSAADYEDIKPRNWAPFPRDNVAAANAWFQNPSHLDFTPWDEPGATPNEFSSPWVTLHDYITAVLGVSFKEYTKTAQQCILPVWGKGSTHDLLDESTTARCVQAIWDGVQHIIPEGWKSASKPWCMTALRYSAIRMVYLTKGKIRQAIKRDAGEEQMEDAPPKRKRRRVVGPREEQTTPIKREDTPDTLNAESQLQRMSIRSKEPEDLQKRKRRIGLPKVNLSDLGPQPESRKLVDMDIVVISANDFDGPVLEHAGYTSIAAGALVSQNVITENDMHIRPSHLDWDLFKSMTAKRHEDFAINTNVKGKDRVLMYLPPPRGPGERNWERILNGVEFAYAINLLREDEEKNSRGGPLVLKVGEWTPANYNLSNNETLVPRQPSVEL